MLLLFSVLGLYSARISISDKTISHSIGKEIKALFISKAGIEHAKYKLWTEDLFDLAGENYFFEGAVGEGYYEVQIDTKRHNLNSEENEFQTTTTIISTGYFEKARYTSERIYQNEF